MSNNRDAGIYNIKAVSRLTGVAADTLRRWESRYNILSPERSQGGYRMYSQRDVDTIRWLRARVEEGLTISRACELLRTREGIEAPAPAPVPAAPARPAAESGPAAVQSLPILAQAVLQHLGSMDEAAAGQVISEALALYNVEQVVEAIVYPVLVQIGEHWLQGSWTIAQEHFASAFLRGRLANLLHSSPFNVTGTLVLVACAPEELHEIGALTVALYLRRSGYRVVYLGQNVPIESLMSMIRTLRPAILCCSASRPNTAANLHPLRELLETMRLQTGYAPLLAYGGSVFNRHPHLAEQMGGVYLGATGRDVLQRIHQLSP